MFKSAARLAILAAVLSFGAAGVALAATGLGLPFVAGASLAAVAAGLVTLSALVLVAMFFNSLYFTFVDCFVHPAPAEGEEGH